MFTFLRLIAGRRLLLLAGLVALAAAGSPAVRHKASRVMACGMALRGADLMGGTAATAGVVHAVSGVRLSPVSPQQCLRDAVRTTAAARTWMQRRSRAP